MSQILQNETANTQTINIVPVQGIFTDTAGFVTFVGPAGTYFTVGASGAASITSGTIDGATIGATVPSTGVFTNIATTTGTISTTPATGNDIVNKSYVDALVTGLDVKSSCISGTTVNITLSGAQTVDGIALVAGDRCLVKNQSTASENGIYVVATGAWTRSSDMDTWAEVPGAFTFIEQGSSQGDTGWVCTANAGGTIGVTAMNWSQFSGGASYTAGTGLTLVGSAFTLSNPVAVNLGGTAGTATPTAGAVAYGSGTAYAFTAAGTSGQFLKSAGAGTPVWDTPATAITITDDTTTNATRYPLFTSATSGTISTENTSSTKFSFNPSTGYLTVTGLSSPTIVTPVLSGSITGTYTLAGTPTVTNPTVTNYTESVVAIGTVTTTNTLSLTNGTVQTATLTASTACTFTMPTATAGKSFVLLLKQAASTGNGTATFTSVKWGTAGAPTITATAGKMDILTFIADGTNWYGSIAQGYTP
jgi:hypothetical protein